MVRSAEEGSATTSTTSTRSMSTGPLALGGAAGRAGASIEGYVAPGFGAVADTFAANFAERGEGGAACAVILDGRTVVDIHGGEARRGVPWGVDTTSVVYSISKGITTTLVLMAVEAGLLDLDNPVASYWPEFAAHGKGRLTVRELLAHRAGLIGLDTDLSDAQLREWFPVVEALAGQKPLWEPGAAYAYHALTFGYLAGEVLRRATGKRPSEWLALHAAGPLKLTMGFGDDVDNPHRALMRSSIDEGDGVRLSVEDQEMMARVLFMRTYQAHDLFQAGNTPLFLEAESPAANVVTRARDLARFYSATVTEIDGVRLLGQDTISDASRPVSFGSPAFGVDGNLTWGTGYMLHSPRRPMAGPGCFGHDGAGGQLAFAHPGRRLGFGFQTAFPGGDADRRANLLTAALVDCL